MTAAQHPTGPETDSRVYRPFATWVVTHRIAVIVAVLAITAFLVTRIGSLQLDTNPDSWAPQNHPYVATTKLLKEVFGGTNVVLIGIIPKQGDIYQPDGWPKSSASRRVSS